jgi:hypothetical protein
MLSWSDSKLKEKQNNQEDIAEWTDGTLEAAWVQAPDNDGGNGRVGRGASSPTKAHGNTKPHHSPSLKIFTIYV